MEMIYDLIVWMVEYIVLVGGNEVSKLGSRFGRLIGFVGCGVSS